MKSSALLCFAVAVVATCDAYDFSDPGFNQFIDAELLDIVAEKDRYLRTKRDSEEEEERSASFDHDETEETHQDLREDSAHHGPSCRKHQKGCCGKTPVSVSYLQHGTNSTSTRSALGDCYEEVNLKMGNKTIENDLDPYNCDKVKRMKKRHVCIHECKAKKQEVANEDGLLEFSKVKDLLTARVNETWQKDLLEKAVDYCAKAKYDETWKDDKEEYKCNPQALQFKHCVWKQVETNCPEEHQNQGKCG
uniref:Odorant-binding protein 18 n=1 Tax=Cyrtorhinus lividipennis TaxID=1032904 RepID=A0A346TI00_9HEMI|nr:odorant-binding protein 18 [Cyrtorhinus lividipennis]